MYKYRRPSIEPVCKQESFLQQRLTITPSCWQETTFSLMEVTSAAYSGRGCHLACLTLDFTTIHGIQLGFELVGVLYKGD